MAPYKAMGGMSGTSGTSCVAKPELIQDVAGKGRRSRSDLLFVSPFAGKNFCFNDYVRGVRRIPNIGDAHGILYDNSLGKSDKRIAEFADQTFKSYVIVRDNNQPATIDLTHEFVPIMRRCNEVYQEIYENWVPKDHTGLILNYEDDIEAPVGAFEKLAVSLLADKKNGTIVADCRDRRTMLARGESPESIACGFKIVRTIGLDEGVDVGAVWIPPRQYGVQAIGSAHMGFWLSRPEAVRTVGMKTQECGILGQDIQYGLRLNEAGYRFLIDWGVKLRHYYKIQGQKKAFV